jgi:hypothetical protein
MRLPWDNSPSPLTFLVNEAIKYKDAVGSLACGSGEQVQIPDDESYYHFGMIAFSMQKCMDSFMGRRIFFILATIFYVLVPIQVIAANLMSNGSFETNGSGWTLSSAQTRSSGWNGVSATDGSKYLTVSGAASIGYGGLTFASQTRSAPFGTGIPTDNFLVILYADAYLHTIDGRNVSYALRLEPGYGAAGSSFYGGARDAWVTAQTWGYYYAHDPYDSSSSIKPIVVSLELQDSLQTGEYLIIDNVQLYYWSSGIPEPASFSTLLFGLLSIGLPKLMRRLR